MARGVIAWAGVCIYCRRAIQRPGLGDGSMIGWWEDADDGMSCRVSVRADGHHEPEVPPVIDGVATERTTDQPGWIQRMTSAGWTVPDGWRFENLGQCRTCSTPVAWCWTPAGNRAPVEKDGTPHFARCPQADQHRRRR